METLQKELEKAKEERRQAFEDKREYDWKFWQGYVNALKFAIGVMLQQRMLAGRMIRGETDVVIIAGKLTHVFKIDEVYFPKNMAQYVNNEFIQVLNKDEFKEWTSEFIY